MEYCTEQGNLTLSPVCRTRCNTWHAGLDIVIPTNHQAGSSASVAPDSPSPVNAASVGVKRPNSRRNAWGTASYADLIAAAIDSAPDRRLTLAQIYDWMVTNVPYFSDKSDSNSSAGWKNSIRHNLSLHRRFVRIPHADGKSSWWTLSHSETPTLRWSRTSASRRRADTMDVRTLTVHRQRKSRKASGSENAHNERRGSGAARKTSPLTVNCADVITSVDAVATKTNRELCSPRDCASSPLSFGNFAFSTSLSRNSTCSTFAGLSVAEPDAVPLDTLQGSLSDDLPSLAFQQPSPLPFQFNVDFAPTENGVSSQSDGAAGYLHWDECAVSADGCSSDDATYTSVEGDKLSDLFSDIAMSYDEASTPFGTDNHHPPPNHQQHAQHVDSLMDDCRVEDESGDASPTLDSCTFLLAATSSTRLPFPRRSPEAGAGYRCGSDAPPPSPECDAGGSMNSFDTSSKGAAAGGHAHAADCDQPWLSASLLNRFNDASNCSDMDLDH